MIYTKLSDCQPEIFDFIKDKPYWGLFAEYGVGKSLLTFHTLKHKKSEQALILSNSKATEEDGALWEQTKIHTDFSIQSLTGLSRIKKEKILRRHSQPRITLLNYDGAENIVEELIDAGFDYVIFDESTKVKNHKTKRFKICKKLSFNIPNRGLTTGSPITENYLNLWPQIFLLDHGQALGDDFWSYMTKYFYKFMYDWHPKPAIQKKIIDKISGFCISRMLSDCLTLPERRQKFIPLPPTKMQSDMFNSLTNDFKVKHGLIDIRMKYILPTYMKLRQICSGFLLSDDMIEKFPTPKDSMLLEALAEINIEEKVLIWCEFKYEVDKVLYLIHDHFPEYGVVPVCDHHPAPKGWREKFKKGKYQIIVSTPKKLGASETLLAKYSIRYSHDWSYEQRANSDARNYRRGSEIYDKIIGINLYVKDSIEEYILKNVFKKKNLVKTFKEYLRKFQ